MRAHTRRIAATAIAATIALGGITACGDDDTEEVTTTEYEDCDTGDQSAKEDDCGYWQKGTQVHVGAQPDTTWLWIWFTWVTLGSNSYPPPRWQPPAGVRPPTRTVTRTVPKTRPCALGPAPAPPPRAPAPPPPRYQPPPAPKAPPAKAPAPARPARKAGC